MKCIVGIPFKNRAELVIRLVRSILSAINNVLDGDVSFRVLLIDDHSDYGSLARIRGFIDPISVVQLVQNAGFGPGAARNTVYDYLEDSDYVAFTDSDCIVDEMWLNEIVHLCKRASPALIQGVPSLFMKNNEYGVWEEKLYSCMFSRYVDSESQLCTMIDSRNLVVSRILFEQMRGQLFSENLRKAAAESRVFMMRIAERGLAITYSSQIKVYHEDPASILDSCFQKYRHGHGRVEIWGETPPVAKDLVERYFMMPHRLGIPDTYTIPVHLSFLYGYFVNSGKMNVFNEVCRLLSDSLKSVTLWDVMYDGADK